jgi:CheY-like chemotaxis protein
LTFGQRKALEVAKKADPSVEPVRVLIVDDHALFRRGLQMVLEGETDIDVVGEAGDGQEAIEPLGP